MRKLLIYVIIFFGALGLGYFAHQLKPGDSPTLLTIDTDYVISYQEEGRFEVGMFTNQPSHALFQKEGILRVIMQDQTSMMMFELTLLDIYPGSKENYLHQTWTKMMYQFHIPYFSEDVFLEDMHLSFELLNQQEYLFRLGKLSLISYHPSLDWTHLSGMKPQGQFLSRLGTLYIGLSDEMNEVLEVSIGSMHHLNFTYQDLELIIDVPKEDYLLYDPALLITLEDGSTYIVHNFRYIIDHMLLKESGPLINFYALY